MNKAARTFSSLVRMPYQDAIAVTLHCYDFHMEMSFKEPEDRDFHLEQAWRLQSWLRDIKEYIHRKEHEDITRINNELANTCEPIYRIQE